MGMYGAFSSVVEDRIKKFGPQKLREILREPPKGIVTTITKEAKGKNSKGSEEAKKEQEGT